jgi:hypothetical protein
MIASRLVPRFVVPDREAGKDSPATGTVSQPRSDHNSLGVVRQSAWRYVRVGQPSHGKYDIRTSSPQRSSSDKNIGWRDNSLESISAQAEKFD